MRMSSFFLAHPIDIYSYLTILFPHKQTHTHTHTSTHTHKDCAQNAAPITNALCSASSNILGATPSCHCSKNYTLVSDTVVHMISGITQIGVTSVIFSDWETYNYGHDIFYTAGPGITPRTRTATAILRNGTAIIMGGDTYNTFGQSVVLNNVEIFDPATNTLSAVSTLNAPFISAGFAVTLPSGIVVLGGGFSSFSSNSPSLATTYLLNPDNMTWARQHHQSWLQQARSRCAAVLLKNGTIMVIGGVFNGRSLSSTEVSNANASLFSFGSRLNESRAWPSALVTVGGLVVVAGGRNDAGYALDTTEFLALNSNEWLIGRSRLNVPRWGASMALMADGRFVIIGGSDSSIFLDSAEIYVSGVTDRGWFLLKGIMNIPRALFSSVLAPAPAEICAYPYGVNTLAWIPFSNCSGIRKYSGREKKSLVVSFILHILFLLLFTRLNILPSPFPHSPWCCFLFLISLSLYRPDSRHFHNCIH